MNRPPWGTLRREEEIEQSSGARREVVRVGTNQLPLLRHQHLEEDAFEHAFDHAGRDLLPIVAGGEADELPSGAFERVLHVWNLQRRHPEEELRAHRPAHNLRHGNHR